MGLLLCLVTFWQTETNVNENLTMFGVTFLQTIHVHHILLFIRHAAAREKKILEHHISFKTQELRYPT